MSIYADSHVEFIHHPADTAAIPNAAFADSQVNPDLIETAKPQLLFLACYVEPGEAAWERLLWVIDQYNQIISARGWNLLSTISDYNPTKINIILHLENAVALGNDLSRLATLSERGLRSIGLTHNEANQFGGGALTESGLTDLGVKLIKQARALGWIIDAAHLSTEAVIELHRLDSNQPLFISHCGLRGAYHYQRNLADQVLLLVKDSDGYVGLAMAGSFLTSANPTIDDYLAHFTYAQGTLANHQIGVGSDLGGIVSALPQGMANITDIQKILPKLPAAGMAGQNLVKFLQRTWR